MVARHHSCDLNHFIRFEFLNMASSVPDHIRNTLIREADRVKVYQSKFMQRKAREVIPISQILASAVQSARSSPDAATKRQRDLQEFFILIELMRWFKEE